MFNALLVALAVTIPQPTPNRIVDQAGLMTNDEVIELNSLFQKVDSAQHVKLGLLTVTTLDDDAKATAVRTLNYWQMTPDAVLLLVSTNPKKMFLMPGSNLASTFNERTSQEILRTQVAPLFRQGRTGQGILNCFGIVGRTLALPVAAAPVHTASAPTTATPSYDTKPAESGGLGFGGVLLILMLIALALYVGVVVYRRSQANRGRRYSDATYDPSPSQRVASYSTYTPSTTQSVATSPAPVTVVNNTTNGGFLEGVLVSEMLHNNQPAVQQNVFVQPSAPTPVASSRRAPVAVEEDTTPAPSSDGSGGGGFLESLSSIVSSSSDDSSSGGSSYDWGSSSSSSSDSYSSSDSGGGSDWGGSSDSGGGSDW